VFKTLDVWFPSRVSYFQSTCSFVHKRQ
jgi:hypothetical protein